MAKLRKRFYVAIHANGMREIIRMRRFINPIGFWRNSSSTIVHIVGPFRTFDNASERIASC